LLVTTQPNNPVAPLPNNRKRCAYPGCVAATERPGADGWTWFQDLGPSGPPDGLYCPAHSAAIKAIIEQGGFEDPDNDR